MILDPSWIENKWKLGMVWMGVFLFAGASGVGKTHLARTLHEYLFSSDYPMVRIDCGEFQQKHENQAH